MNAKKRYSFILVSVILLSSCYFWGSKFRKKRHKLTLRKKSYINRENLFNTNAYIELSEPSLKNDEDSNLFNPTSLCTMEKCFDFSKCTGRPFKVYVYPEDDSVPPSSSYRKIINVIKDSQFYTVSAEEACVFVLSLDTLDRDSLSQDFVRNMQSRLDKLKHWNNGLNHIIFNLYSGTWPSYTEDLGFNTGKAILAKASISTENYRAGFDISLPLFHKHHPERGGAPGFLKSNNFPVSNKYLVAFKGKRYVHGIGSDTRNSLHHLHNGDDVVMVTTCKHGKNWREMMDERCEEDNAEYDRWDYENLLSNSTFCLVPRGRRLGSFRFLETLQAGCLPVILSNGWQLPFDEVIDWSSASFSMDERQLLQVPEILQAVSGPEVFSRRQQTQVLWESYLSTVQSIVLTSLAILQARVHPQLARSASVWNSRPGALWSDLSPRFTSSVGLVPLGHMSPDLSPITSSDTFTAVISVSSSLVTSYSPVFTLIKNLAACPQLMEVLILWSSEVKPPPSKDWAFLGGLSDNTQLRLIHTNSTTRFLHANLVCTNAILYLDEDVTITTDEINFAFQVWKTFQDRIVGFSARTHYWDERRKVWAYSSVLSSEYSMVLTSAAFIHRKYPKLLIENLSVSLTTAMRSFPDCEHILINFLVAQIIKHPPIKVTQRRIISDSQESFEKKSRNFSQKQTCMNIFFSGFGNMPLLKSNLRLDPVLFKDSVSNLRKKYRKMELVQ